MEFKEKWEVILGDRNSYAKIKIRAGIFDLRSLDLKSEQFKEENCIAKLIASAPEMFEMLNNIYDKELDITQKDRNEIFKLLTKITE